MRYCLNKEELDITLKELDMLLILRSKTDQLLLEEEDNTRGNEFKEGTKMTNTNCDNQRPCPCTYDCPRHGKCCACVAHHRDNNEGVPGCFFSAGAEATYDRSIENLARDYGIIK